MDIQALIDSAAASAGLPDRLVAAVVAVESGGDTLAFRFEPAFLERYVLPNADLRAVLPCSLPTERQARAMSWGLMQVMGETARGLGFKGPFLSALTVPQTGLEYGCKLLAKLAAKHKAAHGWPGVVAAYNAGSIRLDAAGRFKNHEYVTRIEKALGGQWPA